MIQITNLIFSYPGNPSILKDISLSIPSGQHVALMGKNGTGKSTLSLILKGILTPTSGTASVDGIHFSDEKSRLEIMKRVGLVFQNPDNTIVSTTVERELAFGLENIGVPHEEMIERVNKALIRFDLERYRHTNPGRLSGGEKQRLALAAVMIMRPRHLILDEPTSLLDPWCRGDILELIHAAADDGATVIHITQFAEETKRADRVIVLGDSGILHDGAPDELHLLPQETTNEKSAPKPQTDRKEAILTLENVSYWYDKNTPFAHEALHDISLSFHPGTSTAMIGPTGSGKSTLLEIAAGITRPTGGEVKLEGAPLRAMAFQFPEDQMYGDTVQSYIGFGPTNTGVPESDLDDVVNHALDEVGLDPESYRLRDPFTLSGGEKRRAALAGVLAMRPEILVLDEPTAGLDSDGVELIFGCLDRYVAGGGCLIFSSHDFAFAERLGDCAVMMKDGGIARSGNCVDVLSEIHI